jgi:hypothetical protein
VCRAFGVPSGVYLYDLVYKEFTFETCSEELELQFSRKKGRESERLCFSLKLCNPVPSASVALDCEIAGAVTEWGASVRVLGEVGAVREEVEFG